MSNNKSMNCVFPLFVIGVFIGMSFYSLIQLLPKNPPYFKIIAYALDLYLCFVITRYVAFEPNFFTSFLLGLLLSQMFLILTKFNHYTFPFITHDTNITRLPYSDPQTQVGCRLRYKKSPSFR